MGAGRPMADWRSSAPYELLGRCGRPAFAWEWLRRSDDYHAAWRQARPADPSETAARFGLHLLEDPALGVPAARPIWRADADPYVLSAFAAPSPGGTDSFHALPSQALATLVVSAGHVEHWLFSDGWRQIRLDILGGSLAAAPAELEHRFFGIERARPRLIALERLIAFAGKRAFTPGLFPSEPRAALWALVLRTFDALAAGAAQREIAAQLYGLGSLPRWRIQAPSYRRRVQRLAEAARSAAETDPRCWLDGSYP
jgi:hypothetical protein